MANHVIPENPQISLELQKFRTTDRAHADIFNNINAKLIENDAYLEKEIREAAKEGIQLTTDSEFVNSLIYNTAKAGSVLLFSNIGERYGNVTGADYSLYAALGNCNQYSGCDITVKPINEENEQSLHPMFFQSPNFFIAKVDKQNAKRVVIYPLGGGNVEELRERLRGVEEKANQAFTQAGEGKKAIVNAFTGLGISANSNETFKSLADKIKTKMLNKFKVAVALLNKGIAIPTTATTEQFVEKINNMMVINPEKNISFGVSQSDGSSYTFPQYALTKIYTKKNSYWYGISIYKILKPFKKALVSLIVATHNTSNDYGGYVAFSDDLDLLKNSLRDDSRYPVGVPSTHRFSTTPVAITSNGGERADWFSSVVSFSSPVSYMAVYSDRPQNENSYIKTLGVYGCNFVILD